VLEEIELAIKEEALRELRRKPDSFDKLLVLEAPSLQEQPSDVGQPWLRPPESKRSSELLTADEIRRLQAEDLQVDLADFFDLVSGRCKCVRTRYVWHGGHPEGELRG